LHLTKKDFVRQTFRAGGPGGQKQNKTETGVRFVHPPSGAVGESREHRTQKANEKVAFRRMAESKPFQDWIKLEHARAVGNLEAWIEQQMRPENLRVEYAESFPDTD
jgi:peptide chain release factor 1